MPVVRHMPCISTTVLRGKLGKLMMDYYRYLRAVQSRFPFLVETKATLQRQMRLALKRPFEPDFKILQYFEDGAPTILDIGANRGQSLDACLMYQQNAQIHAFEPNTRLAKRLSDRFASRKNIQIRATGLADQAFERELYVPVYQGFEYDGLASFDRSEATGWLNSDTMAGFKEDRLIVEQRKCSATTLDNLDLKPDFVKIDVQGFEKQVLKGGEQTLRRSNPLIMLENNPPADELLLSWGWQRFAFDGESLICDETGELNTFYACAETLQKWSVPAKGIPHN